MYKKGKKEEVIPKRGFNTFRFVSEALVNYFVSITDVCIRFRF